MTTMANVLIPLAWRRTQTARLLLDAAVILARCVLHHRLYFDVPAALVRPLSESR